MNVSLTPELEHLVQRKVETGRYLSASEVVREALRLLEERDQDRESSLAYLRKQVAVGIEQADRGDVALLDMEAIKKKARRQASRRKKR
jgi:antitoxin ParD1/3/4